MVHMNLALWFRTKKWPPIGLEQSIVDESESLYSNFKAQPRFTASQVMFSKFQHELEPVSALRCNKCLLLAAGSRLC